MVSMANALSLRGSVASLSSAGNISYSWKCRMVLSSSSEMPCRGQDQHRLVLPSSPHLVLPPNVLSAGLHQFSLSVATLSKISKVAVEIEAVNKSIAAIEVQVLSQVLNSSGPAYDILINDNQKLILQSNATEEQHLIWSCSADDLDLGRASPTGIASAVLVLLPGALKSGKVVRLQASARLDGIISYAYIRVYVNTPPSQGTCSVQPSTGRSMSTTFQLQCNGWVDDASENLAYKFAYQLCGDDSTEKQLRLPGPNNAHSFVIGSGVEGTLCVTAHIRDEHAAETVHQMVIELAPGEAHAHISDESRVAEMETYSSGALTDARMKGHPWLFLPNLPCDLHGCPSR